MSHINQMSYELTNTSYFIEKMDEVIQWLGKKGLKSQLSRYSKYRGYIEEFYRNGNPNSLTDLEQKFKNLNDAMQECIQIVQVYDAFMDEQSKGFEERLQKVVYGTDFYNSEIKADQPRDFLYELLVASWFKSWGYTIDFNQLTDVVATKEDITVYVECKRIKSIGGLEENFKKACKQLSKVNDTKEHYGLVFIDIYNCVADKIRDYEYSSIFSMRKEINDILEHNFRSQNAGKIEDILAKNLESTVGVAFTTVRCLWMSNITPQFYRDYIVVASSKISDEKYSVLQKIFNV